MEGFVFYWLCWSGWIIVTFILNKNHAYRFPMAFHLLVIIILSHFHVSLYQLQLNLSAAWVFVCCTFLLKDKPMLSLLSTFIKVLIVTLAFASFLLFALFDPVWLIFDPYWMKVLLFSLLTVMIFESLLERIVGLNIGMILGEGCYAHILTKWDLPITIGSYSLLDVLSTSTVFLIIWGVLENLSVYYDTKFHNIERERQG